MIIETTVITKGNINDYLGLDIVAFHWAVGGACGRPGGVVFITRDGLVFETNYCSPLYEITVDDLYRIFPPFSEIDEGIFGGGIYPPGWRDKYLGLGNHLVVHESIWDDFVQMLKDELENYSKNGVSVIPYNIWPLVVLKALHINITN
ncbi:MAG: hypothetical protein IKI13_09010 [Bacteroidales bacterium]|nr:hypothetical protein [Bacteroidales bacterium]